MYGLAETFILKLGAQYEAVTTQANFMGVISVKSKSSLTSSVFFLSMWLFTYTFSPSPILFYKTLGAVPFTYSGPGSVVGIATAYGLDGPGIESRWGEIFRSSPDGL